MNKLTILLFLLLPMSLIAQNYAGDDETICQGSGIQIGNPTPDPDLCYTWDMAEGLDPGDIHNPNPTVYPQTETTYTVHVTSDGFGFSASDQVTIDVDFGGLTVTPEYIDLAGTLDDQAQAELNINDYLGSSSDIIWSLENTGTSGCVINQDGVISNCMEGATITVKATNADHPVCMATQSVEVNGGVRAVTAEDLANQGRIAKTGDTLYLVGGGSAQMTAVPNANTTFSPGQPTWQGSHTPPAGSEVSWPTPHLLVNGLRNYKAGGIDPKEVFVSVIDPDLVQLNLTVPNALIELFINGVKGNSAVIENEPFCFPPLEFKASDWSSSQILYKSSNAPKYRDPGYDNKYEVVVNVPAVGIEGCMFFPCCSGGANIGVFSVYFYTYLKAGLALSISVNASKDPNTPNPEWQVTDLNPALTGQLEAGLRLESQSPAGFGLIGEAKLLTNCKLEGRFANNPDKLEWNASWGGLVGEVSLTGYYGDPSNAVQISRQRSLVNGAAVGWKTLYEIPD